MRRRPLLPSRRIARAGHGCPIRCRCQQEPGALAKSLAATGRIGSFLRPIRESLPGPAFQDPTRSTMLRSEVAVMFTARRSRSRG
jgi:hypothetical protein